MEQSLGSSQASYQIQPRVFYEDFKNFVLYVQNVRSGTGASNWDQIFMADVTDPSAPRITTAASATVVSDSSQVLLMRLRNGAAARTRPRRTRSVNVSVSLPPIVPSNSARRAMSTSAAWIRPFMPCPWALCSNASTAPTPSSISSS